ncbi:MAG: hypothetical protein ACLPKB_29240 [Xanthobacteraceae bacterium]
MQLLIKTLLRVGRAVTIAAVFLSASGMLETAGWPVFAAIGEIALNLAGVRSEAEKLRGKGAWTLFRAQVHSVA